MDNDISNIVHWLWHVKNGIPILFRCDRAPDYGDEVRPIWYQNVHEKRRDRVWTYYANSHDGLFVIKTLLSNIHVLTYMFHIFQDLWAPTSLGERIGDVKVKPLGLSDEGVVERHKEMTGREFFKKFEDKTTCVKLVDFPPRHDLHAKFSELHASVLKRLPFGKVKMHT